MNPSANKAIGSLLAACGLENEYAGSFLIINLLQSSAELLAALAALQ